MKKKILIFHPTLLPPRDYGGVERVVLWLARGLIEQGHEVWVAALEGSKLPPGVRLLPMSSKARSALELEGRLPPGIDVVHFMAPPEEEIWDKLPCPALVTVHGNGKPGETFPRNTVFLSQDHARRHGGEVFVYNGIDPAEYHFSPAEKGDWLLFLSKTSWSVKNLSGAMSLCLKAGAKLAIAGGSRPYTRRLQAAFSPQFRWEGGVAGEKKAKLLAEARAFIFPVKWPEPFGLVVVEALISGTPVLASRIGSLPELVPADVGALLPVPSNAAAAQEWIQALSKSTYPWDPERCRAWALEKFHFRKMTEGYEALYDKVMGGNSLHAVNPRAHEERVS